MIKGRLLDDDFYFSSQFVCFHDIFHDHLFLYDIMLRKIPSLNLGLNYDNYIHRTRSRTNFN
ncbi:MAG: hypothetical protein EWV48_02155 [Microcystis aeruginosa Ma_QC_C_20070823_S13]|nr:MAG: hypothetical protein EWV56_06870 [Microcystis aeruginosa Ma_QC_C_20070823_S13D]TRU66606.1 MAG: hypothetical protein EWV48_02155 [Microcystis aeruginosa Ma_QC_C_20070823_S13]